MSALIITVLFILGVILILSLVGWLLKVSLSVLFYIGVIAIGIYAVIWVIKWIQSKTN